MLVLISSLLIFALLLCRFSSLTFEGLKMMPDFKKTDSKKQIDTPGLVAPSSVQVAPQASVSPPNIPTSVQIIQSAPVPVAVAPNVASQASVPPPNLISPPVQIIQGPPGPAGPQGLPGPAGPQGPPGLRGHQGLKGQVGAQGPQGLRGPQGLSGPAGPQGLPGPAGSQGLSGQDGSQGLPGPAGPQGLKGQVGPQGLRGPDVYVNSEN